MLKTFAELRERVLESRGYTLAVVGAAHVSTLQAVEEARKMGLAEAVLIGPETEMRNAAEKAGVELSGFEVINVEGDSAISSRAVELVREGRAGMLMKGSVATGTMLKAVLDRERGLRSGRLLSHLAALEVPGLDRLLFVTDGGMNIAPDVQGKAGILTNALESLRRLGYERPRAAILGAVEKINPDMPDTLDAAALTQMAVRGQFGPCEVDGPLAIDLAVSVEAAAVKGVKSAVAGHADILLVPDIRVGNVFAKGLLYLGGAKLAGMIAGAAAPIVLLSRADDAATKLDSIALCAACSHREGP